MHIVIFTGGECPAPAQTEAYFSHHKPDYVIAADSGILAFERYDRHFAGLFSHGGVPDAILGDMDSLAEAHSAALQKYPAQLMQTFAEDKDDTDTELALEKAHAVVEDARAKGEHDKSSFGTRASSHVPCLAQKSWITLVGAGGGQRADHFLAVFDLFATDLRPDVWLCGAQAFWYAPCGASFTIAGLGLRDVVSVSRTTSSRTGGALRSEGLLWEYDHFRAEGMPSISNRIKPACYAQKKPVTISVEAGEFVLILPIGATVRLRR